MAHQAATGVYDPKNRSHVTALHSPEELFSIKTCCWILTGITLSVEHVPPRKFLTLDPCLMRKVLSWISGHPQGKISCAGDFGDVECSREMQGAAFTTY